MANPIRPMESRRESLPGPVPVPDRALPLSTERPESRTGKVVRGAERLGRAVGTVVENARGLPEQVRQARANLRIVSRRTAADITANVAECRRAAEQRTLVARNHAQQLAAEQPLHLIVGAAGAAFLMGFALRIWRSN